MLYVKRLARCMRLTGVIGVDLKQPSFMNSVLEISLLCAAECSWDAHAVGHSDVQSSYISDTDEILMSSDTFKCSSY